MDLQSTRIAKITDLVAAAILNSDDGVFHETIDHLISDEKDYLIFDLIETSRFIKQQSYKREVTEAQVALSQRATKISLWLIIN
jgi:hypothetical protein